MRETPDGDAPDERAEDGCPPAVRTALRQPVDLGAAARARLATALAAEAPPRDGRVAAVRHAARWLVRPLRLPLPPLAMGAAAALLLFLGVRAGERRADDRADGRAGAPHARVVATTTPGATPVLASAGGTEVVRFVLVAPGAARVALVGDFNAWDAARTPMRTAGDGAWTVEVPVTPGRHVYAFVVDGTRWIADPAAPLAPDDGFGSRNSVLVVGAET